MRRSDSSRPSTASVSKIPGEIVVPASATRMGWKTSFGLTVRASTTPRSASSTALDVNGSSAASAARTSAQRREAVLVQPLLARRRVVGRDRRR